jgi:hypothetical protein
MGEGRVFAIFNDIIENYKHGHAAMELCLAEMYIS